MSCWDPRPACPEDTVGECPACGEPVDKDGNTTLETCFYSPVVCKTCGDKPCDQSC